MSLWHTVESLTNVSRNMNIYQSKHFCRRFCACSTCNRPIILLKPLSGLQRVKCWTASQAGHAVQYFQMGSLTRLRWSLHYFSSGVQPTSAFHIILSHIEIKTTCVTLNLTVPVSARGVRQKGTTVKVDAHVASDSPSPSSAGH